MIKKAVFFCSWCLLFPCVVMSKDNVMAVVNLLENRKQLDFGRVTCGMCPKYYEKEVLVEGRYHRIIEIRGDRIVAKKEKGCCKRKIGRGKWEVKDIDLNRCESKNKKDNDDVYQPTGIWWWDRNCQAQ